MSWSDAKIRSIKPSDNPFKLTDSHCLYLLVNPGCSRLWYLKYRFNRKESRICRPGRRHHSGPLSCLPLERLPELLKHIDAYQQGRE